VQSVANIPIAVLGGTGFLGHALCERLTELGADVTSVSRHAVSPAWRHVAADVTDGPALKALLRKLRPHILVNLAGLASAKPDRDLVMPMFSAHVLSTLHVLDYAASEGCQRVIIATSLEEPEPTDSTPEPASPYAAAKWTASVYGRMFHRLYRTPVVFTRVFMAYGPGPQNLNKVVPYTALSLLRGQVPSLSSGARAFDWIFIDDVAEGLVACASVPGVDGKTIDLGTGQVATVQEVVSHIGHLAGGSTQPMFGALGDRPGGVVRRARVEECQALTGWRPSVELQEGLARTVQWLRSHRDALL
jgi:nucleoside-diphosphate-sugar epimerase